MNGWTDTAQLAGDNPPALPTLPPIAPRTRKPVRLIGSAHWTPTAVKIVAELYRAEQMNATPPATDTGK